MDPQTTAPQQQVSTNTDKIPSAGPSSAQVQSSVPQSAPAAQQTTPQPQTISVGGAESSANVEVQQSTEKSGKEPSPQSQQLIQSSKQLQDQARKAKAQGDLAGAVQQEQQILEQLSGLSPNTVLPIPSTSTTSQTSQPAGQLSGSQAAQSNLVKPPQIQQSSQEIASTSQLQQSVLPQEQGSQSAPQMINQTSPTVSSLAVPTEGLDTVTQFEQIENSKNQTIQDDILKNVQQKYSQFTTEVPASDGTIKASTIDTPIKSINTPQAQGVSHDGFTDVKVVSEPQGTITLTNETHTQDSPGTFHRKFTQAPSPQPKTVVQKPPEQPATQIAEGALGQAVAISLLDAIVKRLDAEEEKKLDKLTVSDSDEASYRFMEEGVLKAVTDRIKNGEWTNKEHLESIATKLGYFAAIDVLRDLKKQALDDKSQTTIQQAIDYLMNEYDQVEISEAKQSA